MRRRLHGGLVFVLLAGAGAAALAGWRDLAALLVVGFCAAWIPLLHGTRVSIGIGFEGGAYLCTLALLLFALDRLLQAPVVESTAFVLGTLGVVLVLSSAIERLVRRGLRVS
jgi:hypothetical protein